MARVGRPALLLRFAILAALLGGLAAGLLVARGLVERRMAEVRESLMTYLQTRLGRPLSYGQVSPSVFREIVITDLKIYSATDPSRVVLSVDRVRASYSLIRLLLTRDAVQALREINLSGSVLTLDYRADPELFTALTNLVRDSSAPGGRFAFAPPTLRVSGSELSVHFVSPMATIGVSRLNFSVSGTNQGIALSLRCGLSGELDLPGLLGGKFETRISVAGTTAPDLSWADLEVQIRSFVHDRLALRDQTFLVSYKDGIIEITKIEDRAPVDLQLTVGTVSRTARLAFRADDLPPSSLLSLRGELARYAPWLTNPVSARGSLSFSLDGGGLVYDVELDTVLSASPLPAPISIAATVSGDTARLEVRSLTADSRMGTARFSGDLELGSLLPQGDLQISGLEELLGRRIAGELRVDRSPAKPGTPRGLHLAAQRLDVGALSLRDLKADVALGSGRADISLTAAAVAPEGTSGAPRATLNGSVSWEGGLRIDVAGDIQEVTVQAVVSALRPGQEKGLPPSVAGFLASGPLRFSTDLSSYSLEMPAVAVSDPADASNHASGGLLVTNERIAIRSLEAAYLGQELSGSAEARVKDGRVVGFDSSFAVNQVPFSVDGSLDENDLRFTGSYGIQGALAVFPFEGNRRDMYFTISSDPLPLPVKGLPMSVSLNLKGAFPDGEDWFVSSDGSRASFRVPETDSVVDAEMDFVLNQKGVVFDRLILDDKVSRVSGSGTVDFVDLARLSVGLSLRFKGDKTQEQYSIDGTISPQAVSLRADAVGSPLARLGQELLTGTFRGSATLSGSLAAPEVSASFAVENARVNKDPLLLSAELSLSSTHYGLKNVRFSLADQRVSEGEADMNVQTGTFSLGGRYEAEWLSDQVKTRITATGSLPGYRLADITAIAFPESLDATLTVSEATVDSVPYPPWEVKVRTDGDYVVFDGGPGGMLAGRLGRDRKLHVSLKDPFPLVGTVDGTLEGTRINAELAVERFEVPVLSTLMSTDVIKFVQGTAAGKVTIFGPLNDPDIAGEVRVTGAAVRSPLSPDVVTPINTRIFFQSGQGATEEEKTFLLDVVTAPTGKGTITAAASFTLDHWMPIAFDLRLTAEPPTGVHVVWRFGTLEVDGYARGTVRVLYDGVTTRLTSKDLVLQSSKLNMNFSDAGAEGGGEPYPLAVDMTVSTGRNVQFSWPTETFPMLKATARQGSVVRVLYDGETNDLVMDGDVSVLGGSLFFFDRSFSIREGSISFHETKLQFDPRVSVRAEIRERDIENRDIRIYLEAERVRLSEFSTETIRFSSNPPLSSAEIRARIGESIFSRTSTARLDTSESGTAALPLLASLTGDVVSQIGILSPVEDKVREVLGLDLFSIRTQAVQNFLVDKILRLDNTTNDLGKYFGNTELTVGKYIGDDLFLEMMVRLQTAEAGKQPGFVGLTGLRPAFEISLEWETPFFILDWSFLPSHPEDLFLSDNTLGIRWRFSY